VDGDVAEIELSECARRGGDSSGSAGADGVHFALATDADDAEIRRLLRENPMPGRVSVSLEREPDARRAAAVEGDVHHTIVARDSADGPITAMGSISVRERYVNGKPTRVGYLGQLRLDRNQRHRIATIRGGYAFLRLLHPSLGVRLYLTSIAADNLPARRLLERGLPGMPTYRPLCEFVTLVFRRRRNGEFHKATSRVRASFRHDGLSLRHGSSQLVPQMHALLNESNANMQFAPAWTPAELESLPPTRLRFVFERDRPIARAAVWDHRALKQAVVRGYPTALRVARVPLNMLAPFTRLPRLPAIGQPLSHAFVSHVATPPDRPELIEPLIQSLHGSANTLDVDSFTIGFDARDPRLPIVRGAFGGVEYRTQLYLVHWPDGAADADAFDRTRIVAPEVALL
jgi:hypothetical protein